MHTVQTLGSRRLTKPAVPPPCIGTACILDRRCQAFPQAADRPSPPSYRRQTCTFQGCCPAAVCREPRQPRHRKQQCERQRDEARTICLDRCVVGKGGEWDFEPVSSRVSECQGMPYLCTLGSRRAFNRPWWEAIRRWLRRRQLPVRRLAAKAFGIGHKPQRASQSRVHGTAYDVRLCVRYHATPFHIAVAFNSLHHVRSRPCRPVPVAFVASA